MRNIDICKKCSYLYCPSFVDMYKDGNLIVGFDHVYSTKRCFFCAKGGLQMDSQNKSIWCTEDEDEYKTFPINENCQFYTEQYLWNCSEAKDEMQFEE